MNKKKQVVKYVLLDVFSAFTAIYLFLPQSSFKLYTIVIAFWVILYTITLSYNRIYYKSRLRELLNTVLSVSLGLILLSLISYIFPNFVNQTNKTILAYFTAHLLITAISRFLITSHTGYKIKKRKIGFNTLLVGSSKKAFDLYEELVTQKKSRGNMFVGYLKVTDEQDFLEASLTCLGGKRELKQVIIDYKVEEVILALNKDENEHVKSIIRTLEGNEAIIKVIPDMSDILSGFVKMEAIYGTPLIEIYPDLLSPWQQIFKRFFDISMSLFFIITLFPIYMILGLLLVVSNNGKVVFSQERIGKKGKIFNIYKFQTMHENAEKNGPQLSSDSDERITLIGKTLRKYRLDELPQFFNVLKGEMSIVGPRPERQFFIDKIMEVAPHYYHLTKVRPGITSWGQVKYGYAETVDEMVARLKYDIIYIENVSFLLDMKILVYTIVTVLKGGGK